MCARASRVQCVSGADAACAVVALVACPGGVAGVGDGTEGNTPYNDPKLTADYVANWVQGANSTYGLTIDYSA